MNGPTVGRTPAAQRNPAHEAEQPVGGSPAEALQKLARLLTEYCLDEICGEPELASLSAAELRLLDWLESNATAGLEEILAQFSDRAVEAVRTLGRLEKRRLVRRIADVSDPTRVFLRVSPEGKSLLLSSESREYAACSRILDRFYRVRSHRPSPGLILFERLWNSPTCSSSGGRTPERP
ncbi:MAG TPA: MarR family winged helix-turn-helix transcriptional regulator [Chthonomonadales bacterium]|nr:MarR family winged helix-turn-helix transcriptional regulator [Chthonomonadales bacterium]